MNYSTSSNSPVGGKSVECTAIDLNAFLLQDESSDDYRIALEHIRTCDRCQKHLDAMWMDDRIFEEVSSVLRDSGEHDVAQYDEVTIPDDLDQTRDYVGGRASMDVAGQLDFLKPAAHPELLGRLGRYDIERVVGVGGTGIVLKAYDSELHRVVALKVLASHLAHHGSARVRFAREARAAAAILHPNVLPIYNVEAEGKSPYLVMQYVAGESLQARVDRTGPLAVEEALRIAKQTAAALAAAHQQGLIHRDVKPANILLEDQTDRVVLSDFGLARTADDVALTRTGVVAGTPQYMSPEQAAGEAFDFRSDLFSLGSVLYFMLAGRPPFRGSSAVAVLHRICKYPHESIGQLNHQVPLEVSTLIDGLLRKKPQQRFSSALDVAERLEGLLSKHQRGCLRLSSSHGIWKVAALAMATALVVGSATWLWNSRANSLAENVSVTSSAEGVTTADSLNSNIALPITGSEAYVDSNAPTANESSQNESLGAIETSLMQAASMKQISESLQQLEREVERQESSPLMSEASRSMFEAISGPVVESNP